jgi:hypothetical protein
MIVCKYSGTSKLIKPFGLLHQDRSANKSEAYEDGDEQEHVDPPIAACDVVTCQNALTVLSCPSLAAAVLRSELCEENEVQTVL